MPPISRLQRRRRLPAANDTERPSIPNLSRTGSSRKIGPIQRAGKKNLGHRRADAQRRNPRAKRPADAGFRESGGSGEASEGAVPPRSKRIAPARSLVTKIPGRTVANASA